MSSNGYREWVRRIDSGRMSKVQCQAFARKPALLAIGGEPFAKCSVTVEEAEVLAAMLKGRPVLLTQENTEQGLTWLRRNGKNLCAISYGMPDVADILNAFSHFSYDGTCDVTDESFDSAVPVWTIHTTDGRTYQYAAYAWQSGVRGDWVREVAS